MTADMAITVVGCAVLVIVSVLIGTSMDTTSQQRACRRVADERRRLTSERRRLVELRCQVAGRCPRCGHPLSQDADPDLPGSGSAR